MRNFIPGITTAISAEALTYFFLLELQLSIPVYFCDGDLPIIYDGHTFTTRSFQFDNLAGSSTLAVESMDINIDDTDKALISTLLNEDARNKTAILYIGVFDTSYEVHIQEFMRGMIGGWDALEDNIIQINLTNELVLWNKQPLRIQMSSCNWVFKGTECGYSGEATSCDQSYQRCLNLGNDDNFGGDRFLSALMQKEIWWGRTQKI